MHQGLSTIKNSKAERTVAFICFSCNGPGDHTGLNAPAPTAIIIIGAGSYAASSVAVGAGAQATGTNSSAFGDYAVASGSHSVAIGNNAKATHYNSTALGAGSLTNADNTVSVGSPGNGRPIQNVAPGYAGTDAVNVNQLQGILGKAKKYAASGVDAALAMPDVSMPTEIGKMRLGAEIGSWDGTQAVGIGFGYRMNYGFALNLGASIPIDGGPAAFRGGIMYEW